MFEPYTESELSHNNLKLVDEVLLLRKQLEAVKYLAHVRGAVMRPSAIVLGDAYQACIDLGIDPKEL